MKHHDPNQRITGALLCLVMAACAKPGTTSPRELTTHSDRVVLSVRLAG